MIGREIRTTVPILPQQLHSTGVDKQAVRLKDQQTKAAYRFFYNRRHSARPLSALQPGQSVTVKLDGEKSWKTPAKVIAKAQEPRSYLIQTDQGTVARRNRRHLQEVPEPASQSAGQETSSDCDFANPQETDTPPPTSSPVTCVPTIHPSSVASPKRTLAGRAIRPPNRFKDYV